MPRVDFRSPRLFLDTPLASGATLPLDQGPTTYLMTVLRLKAGAGVLVFNGRDGEWAATLTPLSRKTAALVVDSRTREQTAPGDLQLSFAPLKHARLDYLVQKAVELGVSRLQPVMTQHTQSERVNLTRMRANAIEAAEQCGILTLPEIGAPLALEAALERRGERLLVFCDEEAPVGDPIAALAAARETARGCVLLIGPEGGFSEQERMALLRQPRVLRLSLGPRILRADTAAVAALALVQAVLGDWRTG